MRSKALWKIVLPFILYQYYVHNFRITKLKKKIDEMNKLCKSKQILLYIFISVTLNLFSKFM